MTRKKAAPVAELPIKIKGMFHIQITENGKVVGDSGWRENQITNDGVLHYLVKALIGSAGNISVSHMALGTGTAPASNVTTLQGEVVKRQTVQSATSNTSRGARFTATFDSGLSFVTTTVTLNNIGLLNSSNNGTLFAGNTFTTSSCATNQNVNATYDITFS